MEKSKNKIESKSYDIGKRVEKYKYAFKERLENYYERKYIKWQVIGAFISITILIIAQIILQFKKTGVFNIETNLVYAKYTYIKSLKSFFDIFIIIYFLEYLVRKFDKLWNILYNYRIFVYKTFTLGVVEFLIGIVCELDNKKIFLTSLNYDIFVVIFMMVILTWVYLRMKMIKLEQDIPKNIGNIIENLIFQSITNTIDSVNYESNVEKENVQSIEGSFKNISKEVENIKNTVKSITKALQETNLSKEDISASEYLSCKFDELTLKVNKIKEYKQYFESDIYELTLSIKELDEYINKVKEG